jgi:L-alanine-DL-glutamate epimerase-like enolase superfamily enzyme
MGLPNAQICAAIRNNDYYEQIIMSEEQIDNLVELGPLAIKDGYLTVSDAPGLGEDFDWDHVQRTALASV